MANPSRRWDRIPIYGVYAHPGGASIGGTVTFTFTQRVLRVDGRVIYAAGATLSVAIGDTAAQDSTIRASVRDAWRAADQAAAGESWDGLAWDVWWDDMVVPNAVFVGFPGLDDPDIVHNPENLGSVTVKEVLSAGTGRTYPIVPLVAHLDLPVPGINLGTIEVPPGSPTNPAPMYAKGVAGGVASLGLDGRVPADQLPDYIGGGGVSSWDDLEDKPAVIAAGASQAAARTAIAAAPSDHSHEAVQIEDSTSVGREVLTAANAAAARTAIGAGTSSLEIGTTSSTAAAGDDSRIVEAAQQSANLSDLSSATTARSNLGLGDSATLSVGTSAGTVKPGEWTPTVADVPAGSTLVVVTPDTTRPTARTDVRVIWAGHTTQPTAAVAGDLWLEPVGG